MSLQAMIDVAQAIVAPGRGILAADESDSTIKKRFDSIGVESTFENRRDYREALFRTAGASEFISGIILFDETIRQAGADGTPLVEVLTDQGVIPGIKVDKSTKPLAGAGDELIAEGLDGLRDRLPNTSSLGRSSPSGGPSSRSGTIFQAATASRPTPRRSPGSRR